MKHFTRTIGASPDTPKTAFAEINAAHQAKTIKKPNCNKKSGGSVTDSRWHRPVVEEDGRIQRLHDDDVDDPYVALATATTAILYCRI